MKLISNIIAGILFLITAILFFAVYAVYSCVYVLVIYPVYCIERYVKRRFKNDI